MSKIVVVRSGRSAQAYTVVSESADGTTRLLRKADIPHRPVGDQVAAATPVVASAITAALAPRAQVSDAKPMRDRTPRMGVPRAATCRGMVCGVGSYGPRHLVNQSLRLFVR